MNEKDHFNYIDDEGCKAIVAGEITFFFTSLNAPGLIDAFGYAMGVVGPNIRWYRTESMSRPRRMTKAIEDLFGVWFDSNAKLRAEYELTLSSGDGPDIVGPWGLRFGVEPGLLPDVAGFFQINIPKEKVAERPDEFLIIARELADRIEFRSGMAGYGVQYDEGELDDERDRIIAAWCARYDGLDYREFAATAEFMGQAIKGVNWLTFIDKQFAHAIEDVSVVQSSPLVIAESTKHGLMLQAGLTPKLGDRNRREDMAAYREVYRLIEPVIVKDDLVLPGFDDGQSIKWIERFA